MVISIIHDGILRFQWQNGFHYINGLYDYDGLDDYIGFNGCNGFIDFYSLYYFDDVMALMAMMSNRI